MEEPKRLYRSNNGMIAGVCAGIADYFGWDPTLLRIVYVLATIFTAFAGIIIYIIPFLDLCAFQVHILLHLIPWNHKASSMSTEYGTCRIIQIPLGIIADLFCDSFLILAWFIAF